MVRRTVVAAAVLVTAFVAFEGLAVCARAGLAGRVSLRQRIWIDDHLLVPGLRDGYLRFHVNEIAAVSTLRLVSSVQAQLEASASVDEDGDGSGEYGTFHELTGAVPLRGRERPPDAPLLGGRWRHFTAAGEVSRAGYLFRIWLPGRGGRPVTETADGLAAGAADPDAAEARWCCYAWPISYDWSGLGTYFVDETGEIYCADDARYSGTGGGPPPDAATGRRDADAMSYTGADGNVWRHRN